MAVLPPPTATTARTPSRGQRLRAPLAVIGGLGAATVALHFRDPHAQGSWGFCPSRHLLGIDCPGCGGLRAVNDLTDGRILDAASSNLLFFVSVPVIVFFLGRWALDAWRGTRRTPGWANRHQLPIAAVGLVLMVAFTVLRNTDTFAWLAS